MGLRDTGGRYKSEFGMTKFRPVEGSYPLLVFDRRGELVVPVNEWYRSRSQDGSKRTADTYLALLLPFFGFLADEDLAWDASPDDVREHVRAYLKASGCMISRASPIGLTVRLGRDAAMSPSGLSLFINAARDFYREMSDGVKVPGTGQRLQLYPHPNPMYAAELLQLRREHIRALANVGAPDLAGIRGESHADTRAAPVGYFRQTKTQWQPPVARDAPVVRFAIIAAIQFMIDRAGLRMSVILRLLWESGARISEVLSLTAGGYRAGQSRIASPCALVPNKGSGGANVKGIRFESETDVLLRRYIARERAQHDPHGCRRIEDLHDDESIFLGRRRRGLALGYSGFRGEWTALRKAAERQFTTKEIAVPLPHITPHTIRHAHATMRFQAAQELYGKGKEYELACEAIEADMAWADPRTAAIYNHAMTQVEMLEQLDATWKARLSTLPRDLPTLMRLLNETNGRGLSAPVPAALPDGTREVLDQYYELMGEGVHA